MLHEEQAFLATASRPPIMYGPSRGCRRAHDDTSLKNLNNQTAPPQFPGEQQVPHGFAVSE